MELTLHLGVKKNLFYFGYSIFYIIFAPMKSNIDWKKTLVFLIVIGGLIFITKVELGMTATNSFLTTLGVLLILFVGDHFAQEIDYKIKERKRRQE